MAREDVIIPQLEPAATDYNRENLDRNFNDVSDTLGRLRDALTVVADEAPGDLTDLENTVASLVEDVYDPVTGLAQTRARILTEEGVRADADLALAARATTLEATVNDGTTGLVATRARLITEESTRADADTALASRATTLEATVNDGTTGLVATRARLITEESTRASADTALASRATTLEATVNDGTTGLVATRARLLTEESARASADAALASRATVLEAKTAPQNTNNYIGNSNFSGRGAAAGHSLDSWTIFGSTGSVYSNIFQTQSYAEITGATVARGIYQDIPVPNEFITGTDYWSMSALVRNIGSGAVRFYLQWLNEARDTSLGYSNTMQFSGSGWEYRKLDGITEGIIRPSAARWIRVHFDNNGATIASGNIQSLTNFTLTRTSYAMPWTASGEVPSIYAAVKTEESTRATADAALASSVTTLTAKTNGNANLFPYPTPVPNLTPTQLGWAGTTLGQNYYGAAQGDIYNHTRPSGGAATTEYYWYDLPDAYDLASDRVWTLSAVGYGGTGSAGDRLQMRIEVWDGTFTTLLHSSPLVTLGALITRAETTTTYTGTYLVPVRMRIVFAREYPSSGSAQDTNFTMIKFEAGPVATAFTNSAQVTVQANAIATLNSSAAFYQILVAASGGDPALIRLFSGLGGSEVAIAAKIISLINTSSGVAMPVMRATGGLAFFQRPISSDSAGRRVTIGPGYGVSGSEVVLWFGPSSIAPDDQSRTNGTFALGTDGQVYFGGTGLQTGSMQMELNTYVVNLTRLGTGTTSTSMTATGYAPGTLSYSWTLHSGDAVNIGSPSSATTNIGHTITALGQTKTSVVKCTITSSAGPTSFRLLDISSSEIS